MVIIPDAPRGAGWTPPNSAGVAGLTQGERDRERGDDVAARGGSRVDDVTGAAAASRGGGSPKNRSSFQGDERGLPAAAGDVRRCSGVGQRPESVGDTAARGDGGTRSETGGDGASSTGVADETRGDMRWTGDVRPDVESHAAGPAILLRSSARRTDNARSLNCWFRSIVKLSVG